MSRVVTAEHLWRSVPYEIIRRVNVPAWKTPSGDPKPVLVKVLCCPKNSTTCIWLTPQMDLRAETSCCNQKIRCVSDPTQYLQFATTTTTDYG